MFLGFNEFKYLICRIRDSFSLNLPYETSSTQTYAANTTAQHAVHINVYQLHIHSIQRGPYTSVRVFVSKVTFFFSKNCLAQYICPLSSACRKTRFSFSDAIYSLQGMV
jgi:hypothetical protein